MKKPAPRSRCAAVASCMLLSFQRVLNLEVILSEGRNIDAVRRHGARRNKSRARDSCQGARTRPYPSCAGQQQQQQQRKDGMSARVDTSGAVFLCLLKNR